MKMRNAYVIPEVERENVQKVIARYQKKAARYGCELTAEFGAPYAKERKILEYDHETGGLHKVDTELVEVFDLVIDGGEIKKDGFTIVAKIEHLDNGNIVYGVSGVDVRPEWQTVEAKCEHCGGKHGQKVTFIVRGVDGTELQVGRTCLKDYCGIDPQHVGWANELHDYLLGDDVERYDFSVHGTSAHCLDVYEVLGRAIYLMRKNGYIPSSEANSSKDKLIDMVSAHKECSAEDYAAAVLMGEEILSIPEDEFGFSPLRNVQVLLKSGYCKFAHFGFLAYAPLGVKRYEEKMKKIAERDAQKQKERSSEWIGEVGKRLVIDLNEMNLLTSWENAWGYTYLYKMVDNNGNVMVWYSSKAVDEMSKIKATVKDHTERDGVKQTVLTRCVPA